MNEFYGNTTDTILKSSKGIFLIASQDRPFDNGDYETLKELPSNVTRVSSALIDQDMIEDLPEEISD